jgi:hypothetical protein
MSDAPTHHISLIADNFTERWISLSLKLTNCGGIGGGLVQPVQLPYILIILCTVIRLNALHPLFTNCQSSLTVIGKVSVAKLIFESSGIESIRYRLSSILIIHPPQHPHKVMSNPVIVPTDL